MASQSVSQSGKEVAWPSYAMALQTVPPHTNPLPHTRTPRSSALLLWYDRALLPAVPVAKAIHVGPVVLMGHVAWAMGRTTVRTVAEAVWV